MSAGRAIALAALTLLAAPLSAPAQAAHDAAGIPGLCWAARPAPACKVLLITNFGAYLDYPKELGVNERRLEGELGLMVNVAPRDAVGATFVVLTDKNGRGSEGLELRYRRWLGARSSVELAAGYRGGADLIDNGAVIGMVKYNFGPYFGVVVRPELLRSCPELLASLCARPGPATSHLRVSVGFELGSWPGVAAAALVGIVAEVVSAATHVV